MYAIKCIIATHIYRVERLSDYMSNYDNQVRCRAAASHIVIIMCAIESENATRYVEPMMHNVRH
jgi:hypothetical protein